MFVFLQGLVPQHLLSRLVGFVANSQIRFVKDLFIRRIVARYQVDLSEAERPDLSDYKSFNDFFTRKLAPGTRPVEGPVCSPADGEVSAAGDITAGRIFQAKGIDYSLAKLRANTTSDCFHEGSFITIYLAPRDYHRVHCPMDASLEHAQYIPGKLFSVNQQTANSVTDLFAVNERLVMEFETASGPMTVIMVGAMIVAAIQPVWRKQPYRAGVMQKDSFDSPIQFKAGDELGQFSMGSTAIVLFSQRQALRHESGDRVLVGQSLLRPD